ncbi:MAG: ribosome-inactivating family protein [Gemmatimonadota bacterium]
MDVKLYTANLRAMMLYLTTNGGPGGALVPLRDGNRTYQEIPISYSGGSITLLFKLGDLYLEGFRNTGGGWFLFKGGTHAVNAVKRYTIGTDYGDLGLDRNGNFTLTLAQLDQALTTLHNATPAKAQDSIRTPMWQCAVGLSEALRFQDVALAVIKGTNIPSLDWSARTKAKDFRVRVLHQ